MKDELTLQEAVRRSTEHLAGHGLKTPRQDAELLVLKVTGKDRAFLLSHPEWKVAPEQQHQLEQWLEQRRQHYPIQYLVGSQEFFGRLFRVDPSVLIPRPETELIAETGLELVRTLKKDTVQVLDIGTGSGCIAVTLACEDPRIQVAAVDISETALDVARENARCLGCIDRVEFLRGDVLGPLESSGRAFDLIVSNPPYVEDLSTEVEYSVKTFEPREAVFAGPTGLEIYGRIFRDSRRFLRRPGWLVLEMGYGIVDRLTDVARGEGWRLLEMRKDLAGIPRCAVFEEVLTDLSKERSRLRHECS
ncbi:MAG: peptide chain release factor N(5)-glutamine methyltransferase [Acidobacteria bacterium]|nr:MAG: peptide chain release factor N(5)-glutamine methyltransferase [Acidobacteriota bacterium]